MDDTRVDVVMYPSGEVKAVPAGKGAAVVRSYRERVPARRSARRALLWLVVAIVIGYSILIVRNVLLGILAAGIIYAAFNLVPRFTTDADLLDDDVTLRDAREQWDAEPVSEVAPPDGRERTVGGERREREHAYE